MKKERTDYPWNPKLTGTELAERVRETTAFVASLMRKHGLTDADVYPERKRCTERSR